MIARIWHGEVAPEKSEEYLAYLERTGVRDYRTTEGNLGVYVLRRIEDDAAHVLTVSFWESVEKVEGFAGPEPEKARYYPGDEDFLLDFEPTVLHYEVVVEPQFGA